MRYLIACIAVGLMLTLGAIVLLGWVFATPTDEQLIRARCAGQLGWDGTPAQIDVCFHANETTP